MFDSNDPIYIFRRDGSESNPFLTISEPLMVNTGRVLLTELPEKFNRVVCKDSLDVALFESQSPTVDEDQFYVDYNQGIVYFHSSRNGETLTFDYKGTGVFALSDSRIYTQMENGVVTETLKQLSDETKSARDTANTTNSNVSTAESGRVSAESTRVTNENNRITSENNRNSNESTRTIQENARVTAETARQTNTTTAINNANAAATNATTQANFAQTQGNYAKTEADRLVGMDVSVLDTKVTNLTKTPKTKNWVATAGQLTYTFTTDSYTLGQLSVYVGGVLQMPVVNFTEDSTISFTLLCDASDIPAGITVYAIYRTQ